MSKLNKPEFIVYKDSLRLELFYNQKLKEFRILKIVYYCILIGTLFLLYLFFSNSNFNNNYYLLIISIEFAVLITLYSDLKKSKFNLKHQYFNLLLAKNKEHINELNFEIKKDKIKLKKFEK